MKKNKMKEKTILYQEEQKKIVDEIAKILDIQNKEYLVLYEMDRDTEMQRKIMALIPEIKKFFRYDKINGVKDAENTNRAYLSIIKCLTKDYYDISKKSYTRKIDGETIYSKKYIFNPKK